MFPNQPKESKKQVAFRPRILYCALFVWNTVTCGKFIAPLLQTLSPKFTDSLIGTTLSIQYAIVALFAGFGGSLADRAERKFSHWGHGRLLVIAGSILLGTFAFLGHAIPEYLGISDHENTTHKSNDVDYVLLWHILMRFIYAISMAISAPALDGLALAHLERMDGASQEDFGKERMYGAMFWGLGSLANGVGIERFGFDFLYIMVIFSIIASYAIMGIYIFSLEREESFPNKDLKDSSYQTLDISPEQSESKSKESENVANKDLFLMLCDTGYGIAFCIFLFVLAMGISVVDNLAFIFFAFLGSSDAMNGISVMFTVFMEIPCFHYAPVLLKRYGPGTMLLIAGAAFVIRMIGYTLVPKGHMWMVLILETLHGFTYACQQVGSVEYVARLMPKGYEASGQGILIFIKYFGVVIGLFSAGWVEEAFGMREMYGFMGTLVFLGMVVLVLAKEWSKKVDATKISVVHEQNGENTCLLQK